MAIGLTDSQQAYLMLLVFVLPSVSAWLALGAPIDKTALALLGSSILSGFLAFLKEKLGLPVAPTTTTAP